MNGEIFALYFMWSLLIVAIFISTITYLCLKYLQTQDIEKSGQASPVQSFQTVCPEVYSVMDCSGGSPSSDSSILSSSSTLEEDKFHPEVEEKLNDKSSPMPLMSSPWQPHSEQSCATFYQHSMDIIPAMVKTKPQKNGEEGEAEAEGIWKLYQELDRCQPKYRRT